jgi:hypothetical protein
MIGRVGNFSARSTDLDTCLLAQRIEKRIAFQLHQAWITQPQSRFEPLQRLLPGAKFDVTVWRQIISIQTFVLAVQVQPRAAVFAFTDFGI